MSSIISLLIGVILTIPGARLALLWRRTHLSPEGLLALFFLGFAFGIPLRLFLTVNRDLSPSLMEGLNGAAVLSLLGGVLAMVFFTRAVFRRTSRFARAFCWLSVLVLASSIVILFQLGALSKQVHPVAMAANVWALPVFWWAFCECVAQYRKMRRQAAIGIGDPLVRNRFLLWSLWTGAISAMPTAALTVKLALVAVTPAGQVVVAPPLLMAFIRTIVLVCASTAAVAIWLSFFPPKAYARWTRRGSETAASSQ